MKIKTSELKDRALDYVVAQAAGVPVYVSKEARLERMDSDRHDPVFWMPSVDWSQGGPIIEREKIGTFSEGDRWVADLCLPDGSLLETSGPTPLIAAMRCYVASKLGEVVDVPEELL